MRRKIWLLALLALVRTATPMLVSPSAQASPSPPNIVLIMTDDQRWDTMWAMRTVRHRLIHKGVAFTDSYVVNPECCPSRVSTLTGKYSHGTGIYSNDPPHGGFEEFKASGGDRSTIATWLDAAGYDTALVGKYLNGYSGSYIPPGWDYWAAINGGDNGGYRNYQLNINGTTKLYGDSARDYSTGVFKRRAISFIDRATSPLFLEFAPVAPHKPARPANHDRHAFPSLRRWRPSGYNEGNVTDKPEWVRSKARLDAGARRYIDRFRRHQYQTLLAVDRAVGRIIDELRATGRLENTMIVFMSDNGFFWGEHRLFGKWAPYEESVRVPMIVRYDPMTSGGETDSHLVLNIDLAPTFAELAGIAAPGVEGRSMVPLLGPSSKRLRRSFLVEHLGPPVPAYCSVHSSRFVYVLYETGEEELYDLTEDPYELHNLAADARFASELAAMRVRLKKLCDPPPPGLTVPF